MTCVGNVNASMVDQNLLNLLKLNVRKETLVILMMIVEN